ncbi:MAG: ATP-binding cassette domain-containing protein [Candidatus Bathyarchaeia archaeon]|jgi:ABC-type cobalamin/Fe3+-siderophores transport system ATPase subunit
MADVAVETENLSYAYPNGTTGLRDVTVILERGKLISIMGPNCSGKSTFAKQLNGLLRPTKGLVRVCGMDKRYVVCVHDSKVRSAWIEFNDYRANSHGLSDLPQLYSTARSTRGQNTRRSCRNSNQRKRQMDDHNSERKK